MSRRFTRTMFTQCTRLTPSVAVFGDLRISEIPAVMALSPRMVFTRGDVPKKLQIRASLSRATTPLRALRRKHIRWVDHPGSFWNVGGRSLFWDQVGNALTLGGVSPLQQYWQQLCGVRAIHWVIGRRVQIGIKQ